MGEPRPAPSRGISPKKGHLSCTEKEQERKKRKRRGQWQLSGRHRQTQNQGGDGWAAIRKVAGCGLAFVRGAVASQGGALGLMPAGIGSGCPSYHSPTQAVPSSFGSKPRLQRLLLRQRYPP